MICNRFIKRNISNYLKCIYIYQQRYRKIKEKERGK